MNHTDVPEAVRCARCGQSLCENCFVTLEGQPFCGPCKALHVRELERGEAVSSLGRRPSPWEQERSLANLAVTVREVLLHPSEFFRGLALEGQGHWTFLAALAWPSALLGGVLSYLFPFPNPRPEGTLLIVEAVTVVLAPLLAMLGAVIQGSLIHLFLRLAGAANARPETTIRAVAYTQALAVVNWIPVAGPLVGAIAGIAFVAIGVKEMHAASYGRVLLALLLPTLTCVVPVIMLLVFSFFAGR